MMVSEGFEIVDTPDLADIEMCIRDRMGFAEGCFNQFRLFHAPNDVINEHACHARDQQRLGQHDLVAGPSP